VVQKLIEDTRSDKCFWYLENVVNTDYACHRRFQPRLSEYVGGAELDVLFSEIVGDFATAYALRISDTKIAVPHGLLRRLYKEIERSGQRRRKREQDEVARQFLQSNKES